MELRAEQRPRDVTHICGGVANLLATPPTPRMETEEERITHIVFDLDGLLLGM